MYLEKTENTKPHKTKHKTKISSVPMQNGNAM